MKVLKKNIYTIIKKTYHKLLPLKNIIQTFK